VDACGRLLISCLWKSRVAHRPVLLDQALDALRLQDGGVYVDATFGGGGYSRAMLDAASCRVMAFDRDPDAVARARLLAAERAAFTIFHAPFGGMREALAGIGVRAVDGIVFDLGVSSFQLDQGERGFSFQIDGPLDMRMSRSGPSAADLVNVLAEPELARLLFTLGDEPQARSVARAIVKARAAAPLTTTGALAAVVSKAKGGRRGPRDPATRTFQALRMAVNDEVGELERGLAAAEDLLRPGGRLAIVSFHSGEDAAVKTFVNRHGGRQAQPSRHLPPVPFESPRWRWVKTGVIKPSAAELAANPRGRSARLRVAERLAAAAGSADDVEGGTWPLAA
jgi:16S rRNA (cytosine1402-N4)-methyltransferase